jgi:hypothetical protein
MTETDVILIIVIRRAQSACATSQACYSPRSYDLIFNNCTQVPKLERAIFNRLSECDDFIHTALRLWPCNFKIQATRFISCMCIRRPNDPVPVLRSVTSNAYNLQQGPRSPVSTLILWTLLILSSTPVNLFFLRVIHIRYHMPVEC